MSPLSSPPISSLVAPGKCQFSEDFTAVPLLERTSVSATTSLLKFGLPDASQGLGLSTCAAILARVEIKGEGVVRPYTPISTNEEKGSFHLLVKHYDGEMMSDHMKKMDIGSTLEFKHIAGNVKIQAPFKAQKIGMIVGGTGINPMIQALHHILGDADAKNEVSLVYGSRVSTDILGDEMLTKWAAENSDQFSLTVKLSHEPADSAWDGERGYINKDDLAKHLPGPDMGDDVMIFVCGPPPMYDVFCGPREEDELKGLLAEMGYKKEQVYKF